MKSRQRSLSSKSKLQRQLETTQAELNEALETLQAIQTGEVDALVVSSADGEKIFTLKSADQPYRVLVETMNEGAATLDGAGTIFYANSCLARFLGRALEATIGTSIIDFIQEDDQARFKKLFDLGKSNKAKGEFSLKTRGKKLLPTVFSMSAVALETGPGVSLVITDVTEQKRLAKSEEDVDHLKVLTEQAEAALAARDRYLRIAEDNAAQFTSLANSIPTLAWMADPDGSVFWYNQRWFEYTGTTPAQMEGWGWQAVHHPDFLSTVIESWKHSIDSGTPFEMSYPIRGVDGKFRVFLTRVIPVRNDKGKILRWFGTNTDIEDTVAQGKELEAAKAVAEEANLLKSAFLANMSHEIRTPLGAIIGFADLLRDPLLSDGERISYLNVLTRNGHQLSHIINDILDLSKVESGRITLENIAVNPAVLATEVISFLSVMAKDKGLLLELTVGDDIPESVNTDPVRVRQILTNIIGNAIKFTRAGKISVVASAIYDEDRVKGIAYEISDTGVGIPQSDVSKLFQVFSQADVSVTRKFGGTGLGLALSKKLANALGGDLELVRSTENAGSTFRITIISSTSAASELPFKKKAQSPVAMPKNHLQDVNILLVDDSPDNQQLIWHVLSKAGVTMDLADNGLDGVEKALKGRHDLVLMDLQMPIMDGYTATQKLREKGYDKPIIALTAHAMSEIRLKCLNVGCTDHLTKPINFEDLLSMVGRHTVDAHAKI